MKEQYCMQGAALFHIVDVKQSDANMPAAMWYTHVNKLIVFNTNLIRNWTVNKDISLILSK